MIHGAVLLRQLIQYSLFAAIYLICYIHISSSYNGWAIHPEYHDENFIQHIDDLIETVEKGLYPFRRGGFQWDMCTEGKHIKPWLKVINRMKKRDKVRYE